MRYAYGISSALLAGGAAISLITGIPAGAQVTDSAPVGAVVPRPGAPASFADLTEQLQPAVVNISTRQKVTVQASPFGSNPFAGTPFADLFGPPGGGAQPRARPQTRETQSLGSGFIISADGYVVTNNHVITADGQGEVEEITVTLTDGTEFPATLVGRDAASDLAVLKIERASPFPHVEFGDASKTRVGDWVLAIGNPFGLGGTVTSGIVSAVYRNTGAGGAYDRYLQTDASINRGNSGGPLFDMAGRVVGINNAIFSPSGGSVGIGFAIPADIAAPIVEKLRSGKEIERGYIGVRIQPLNEDIADSLGLPVNKGEFIQSVEPGEPADKAGIEGGDIVLKVGAKDVTQEQSLSYHIANIQPGTTVPLLVVRDGKQRTVNVTVGKRPSEEELAKRSFDPDADPLDDPREGPEEGLIEEALGLQVMDVTPQLAGQLGVERDTRGLVVIAADPGGDAAAKGVQRGDIILSANYRPVTSIAELEAQLKEAKANNREAVLLRVQRRGRPATYVPVRLR